MSKAYKSEPFDCKDTVLTVSVDPGNYDGIVMLEGVRTDYDAEGKRVILDLEVDASQIDALIEALMVARTHAVPTGSLYR